MNKRQQRIQQIFDEEIKVFIENLDEQRLAGILRKIDSDVKLTRTQLRQTMHEAVQSLQPSLSNEIPSEAFQHFVEMLKKNEQDPKLKHCAQLAKIKAGAKSHFRKVKIKAPSDIEHALKIGLQRHWSELSTDDSFEFVYALECLPLEFMMLIVFFLEKSGHHFPITYGQQNRYISSITSSIDALSKAIEQASTGKSDLIPLRTVKRLMEVDAFWQKTEQNAAILEYLSRLLARKSIRDKIELQFGEAFVENLGQKINTNPCYKWHLSQIKQQAAQPFFTASGQQNPDNPFKLKTDELAYVKG